MVTKHLKEISDILADLGLELNGSTGGMFVTNQGDVNVNYVDNETTIRFNDRSEIVLLNGDLFLKSLRETESSFNIKLFVNI